MFADLTLGYDESLNIISSFLDLEFLLEEDLLLELEDYYKGEYINEAV